MVLFLNLHISPLVHNSLCPITRLYPSPLSINGPLSLASVGLSPGKCFFLMVYCANTMKWPQMYLPRTCHIRGCGGMLFLEVDRLMPFGNMAYLVSDQHPLQSFHLHKRTTKFFSAKYKNRKGWLDVEPPQQESTNYRTSGPKLQKPKRTSRSQLVVAQNYCNAKSNTKNTTSKQSCI